MRGSRLYLLGPVMVLTLTLLGCGGGGGSGAASSPALDLTADQSAMTAVETALSSAQSHGLSLADQATAVLAAMQQPNSGFVDSGISSDNSVWGRCKDGLTYIVCTNDADLDGITLTQSVAGSAASTVESPRPATLPVESAVAAVPAPGSLPGSAKAYVFSAMEPNRLVPDATIASQLIAAGYNVVRGTGSLTDWQGVSGAGVVYSAGHGAPADLPAWGITFFFEASDLFHGNGDAALKLLNDSNGKLAVMGVDVLNEVLDPSGVNTTHKERHYAISSRFLTSTPGSAMFTGNSLMYLHACSGMSPSGSAFASTLGTGCSLSLYAGWTLPVLSADNNETASFFFDRALGLNQFAPIDPTDPPPGDWAAILATMGSTSRASGRPYSLTKSLFETKISTFNFQQNDPANLTLTTLIPSISSNSYDPVTDLVTLTGSFGPDQGIVTLSGSYLSVQSWDKGTITVTRPDQPTGDLLVTSPLGLKSNLTAYNGPAPDAVWTGTSPSVTNASSFPIYATCQVILNEFKVDDTHVYYTGTSIDPQGPTYALTCGSATAPLTVTSNGNNTYTISAPSGCSILSTNGKPCTSIIPITSLIRNQTQLFFPGATYTWSAACDYAVTTADPFTLTKQ